MTSDPEISVLMAVHNGEAYLKAAIDSVLAQSFEDFEFVIVDDASSDGSVAIIAEAARLHPCIRIVTNAENLGLTRSLNVGLEHCRGRFVARMDADDICMPERLSVQWRAMQAEPDLLIIGGGCALIDAEGVAKGTISDDLSPSRADWLLSLAPVCYHPTYFFRRVLPNGEEVRYDPAFVTAQDYDLWSRLAELGATRVLPDQVLRYRRHDGGISAQKRAEQGRNAKAISLRILEGRFEDGEVEAVLPLVEALAFERDGRPGHVKPVVAAAERLIGLRSSGDRDELKWRRRMAAAFAADALFSRGKGLRNPISVLAFAVFGPRLVMPLAMAILSNPARVWKSLSSVFRT